MSGLRLFIGLVIALALLQSTSAAEKWKPRERGKKTPPIVVTKSMREWKKERWCCRFDYQEELGCQNGFLWLEGSEEWTAPYNWSSEVKYTLVFAGASNLAMLPALVRETREGNMFSFFVGFGVFVSSSMYHICDAMRRRLLGMNPGQWHRLDNVFAVMAFVALLLHLSDLKTKVQREGFRWGFLVLTMFLLELGPWRVECTAIPITLALFLFLARLLTDPQLRKRLWNRNTAKGLVCLCISFTCFARGLDVPSDPNRFFHGCWHLFNGAAFYFLTMTVPDSDQTLHPTISKSKILKSAPAVSRNNSAACTPRSSFSLPNQVADVSKLSTEGKIKEKDV